MKIAILGAGNGGCAIAADLSIKGHEVTLIKTSNAMHNDNFNYLIKNGGKIKLIEDGSEHETIISKISKDVSDVKNVELIIIYTQTIYHECLLERIHPYLKDGQILMFNPGYLSTAYALKYCKDVDITVVEATSSFIDCRIIDNGIINVSFRNVRNPLGVYPKSKTQWIKDKLEILQYNFFYFSSVIEAALHNPNLIVHTVGAIMSIPRVEKTQGDYCMYHEVFTPSVWSILEELDSEKMNVLECLNCQRLTYVEACKFRNTLDDSLDAKEVFFWYASMPNAVKGPTTVDSRYITEDVSQGLVMLESLGKELEIDTPICSSLIELANAALERDFRSSGRTLARFGHENIKTILNDKL